MVKSEKDKEYPHLILDRSALVEWLLSPEVVQLVLSGENQIQIIRKALKIYQVLLDLHAPCPQMVAFIFSQYNHMSVHSQAVKEVYITMLYSLIQKGLLLPLICHSAG